MRRVRVLLLGGCCGMLACNDGPSPGPRTGVRGAAAQGADELLMSAGESLYFASEFDSARVIWTAVSAGAVARSDSLTQARALTWLGLVSWKQGDLTRSRELQQEALRIKLDQAYTSELAESYNALGLLANDEEWLPDARRQFEEAVRSAERAGDRRAIAKASGNLGLTLAYLGELSAARQRLEAMRDSARVLGEQRYEANAIANLAMLDIWEGNPQPAIALLGNARAVYQSLDYLPGEQNALGQLATAYTAMGEYAKAFAALDTSLALARSAGLREEEAEILRLIASLHARLGDYRASLRSFEQAALLAQELGLSGETGTIRRSTAVIHHALGDTARARADAQAALAAHRTSNARVEALDDMVVLSAIQHEAGRAVSDTLLDAAERLGDSLGSASARLAVAMARARLADRDGAASAVLRALRSASPDVLAGDFAAESEMHALAARAWARLGRSEEAARSGRRAVAAIERVRSDLASEPLRRTVLADRNAIYGDLVRALLRLGKANEALLVADAARSRGIVERFGMAGAPMGNGSSTHRLGEGERLLRRIDVLLGTLKTLDNVPIRERGAGSHASTDALAMRLDSARTAYEGFLARTAKEGARGALVAGVSSASVGGIRDAIAPGEALLEYLVTQHRVLLFVVTKSGVRVVETDRAAALSEQIRVTRDFLGMQDSTWRLALPALRSLHRSLLGVARDSGFLRNVRRLVVVPHGVLAQLPFAALQDGRTGRFVMEDFTVLYAPSAAAFMALRTHGAPVRRSGLQGASFAPMPRELPASRDEARAVRAGMQGARVMVGRSATERAVREALARRAIVHIASHGILNARNPMFTRVELARPRGRDGGTDDDGRLEVHELLGLSVESPLVFLSGCETNAVDAWLVDPVLGTDHTALAQAFLYAGAANVAGTLWRIDDVGAAAFAEHFYRALAVESPAEAMASAQRAMSRDPRFRSPYYWAAYVLNGAGVFGE